MQIEYKNFNSKRRFGVEIELTERLSRREIASIIEGLSYTPVERRNGRSINNKSWHVKVDHSCGYEIASFVGQKHQDILHIGEIVEAIYKNGGHVYDDCGLHVHVETRDFTEENVGILLGQWIKVERVLKYAVPLFRRQNLFYCELLSQFITSKYFDAEDLYEKLRPQGYVEEWDRYRALNICNYYNAQRNRTTKNTVEFRLPESSLNPEDVVNWTRLFVNFVEYTKTQEMPKSLHSVYPDVNEALTILGLNHHKDKFYIFSPGLNETRKWLLTRLTRYAGKNIKLNAKKLLNDYM